MATLRERRQYREAVLRALYLAVTDNRTSLSGDALREAVDLPGQDLAAACRYLADEGLISVDWTSHRTPTTVTLTHEGLRHMETEEDREG
ncbi:MULTISPECIES: hypothetical protein [Streptomycetaceae]|uniref:Uncharacterized protein n=1 Tax=Streptantibioticus cattleyicolor (strain ATCC 35852 / DSM 46488 / JCM 4925 / NBRC 14057 / NRRL 8057) TaxID=1003195 RepID=F8K3F8_STREN|nr:MULTISPECIES: hypothetical protein [Streptomycetaceae]AEW95077.1 hypothetical protein SCATT_27060 [Streptantibioticus cattleyicolor NRRL 8057 = DSM 46488]MYS59671.1 hypothetical protein [Streptomyces sp. SID5468]CCB75426.1 conserved protein of unknown function [Streptantibioticus cattleyicolor NRRL 8057 = DSM 46488]